MMINTIMWQVEVRTGQVSGPNRPLWPLLRLGPLPPLSAQWVPNPGEPLQPEAVGKPKCDRALAGRPVSALGSGTTRWDVTDCGQGWLVAHISEEVREHRFAEQVPRAADVREREELVRKPVPQGVRQLVQSGESSEFASDMKWGQADLFDWIDRSGLIVYWERVFPLELQNRDHSLRDV